MTTEIALQIPSGNFEGGFTVGLEIQPDKGERKRLFGELPATPEILSSYQAWQSARQKQGFGSYRKLERIPGQTTKISVLDLADALEKELNRWLNSGDDKFRSLRDELVATLKRDRGRVRLMIQTNEPQLWQLPWHLWDILDRYQVEPILSPLNSERDEESSPKNRRDKVRVLVILGDGTGIDIQADSEEIQEQLQRTAEITVLFATRRQQLSQELWEKNWDILFFAGHSTSNPERSQGYLELSETERITIEDLKYGLRNAIGKGLKLAIFNSCDGLGLAKELVSLHLPALIVMRERIPDEIAQLFLGHFLKAFGKGRKSLRDSIREARERLQDEETRYPCASWLPALFVRPDLEFLTWKGLLVGNEKERRRLSLRRGFLVASAASFAATGLVMGLRFWGKLEFLELWAYDRLLVQRPPEQMDERILIVEANNKDFEDFEDDNTRVLSDNIIAKAIKEIEKHNPVVIGLNIARPDSKNSGSEQLESLFKNKDGLISVCAIGDQYGKNSIKASPAFDDFSKNRFFEKVGFVDIFTDGKSSIFRRQLFWMTPYDTSQCPYARYSFPFLLADRYLEKQGKKLDFRGQEPKYLDPKSSSVSLKKLSRRFGGYQNLSGKSMQILLSYRSPNKEGKITQTVSLRDVIDKKVASELITNKIVIVGVAAKHQLTQNDIYTPYGKKHGLWIDAQMVSSILSIVEKDRRQVWVLPQWKDIQWGDIIWIFSWSLIGSLPLLFLYDTYKLKYILLTFIAVPCFLYSFCLFGLVQLDCWLPLIPTEISVVTTGGTFILICRLSK